MWSKDEYITLEMVEVFKTNIQQPRQAKLLLDNLAITYPYFKINFDLEDCDKILRIEGKNICTQQIIEMLKKYGYQCTVLL